MKYPATSEKARISEVFSSLQGEGTHLGQRHLFVRFEECHIHCQYCDELHKIGTEKTQFELLDEILELEKTDGPHAFVSLTGGEPLLYLSFIKPLIAKLKQKGLKIYLETSGVLWKALQEVVQDIDCIAMDIKPPSVTKEKNFDLEHRKFLSIAVEKEVFIKCVISNDLVESEFFDALAMIKDINPEIPVILQPVSAEMEGHEDKQLMSLLNGLQKRGLSIISDIRIVPRFHKILKVR